MSTVFRLALALSSMATSVVLIAAVIGLIPDRREAIIEGRIALVESLAIESALLAKHNNTRALRACIEAVVSRNKDLIHIEVRRKDGFLVASSGAPSSARQHVNFEKSASTMSVPIFSNKKPWGKLNAEFKPLTPPGWLAFTYDPVFQLVVFLTSLGFFVNYFYLRRILKQLDPTQAVPERVRETLDTMAEGLLIIDAHEQIVTINDSFTRTVGLGAKQLIGKGISELPWSLPCGEEAQVGLPWRTVLENGTRKTGQMIELTTEDSERRTFLVNCSPIQGENNKCRGVLVSFEDITPLEKKKAELSRMLDLLQRSSDEIKRQNVELERLSRHDPLTGCFNRRAFFLSFDNCWNEANRYQRPLGCIMLDIDHFKSINDNYGHSAGDEVLKGVATKIRDNVRSCDTVCRYGGEEFCILLPESNSTQSAELAERLREKVETLQVGNIKVTISLGVSSLELSPSSPQEMLDQADKSLYVAKRKGRNRVVCFDASVDAADSTHEESASMPVSKQETGNSVGIPFHAVTALISALSYRDHATAEHSRRVADLCVELGREIMSKSDCYILEIAALLHDIGKIGVPDSILLKPGPLTSEEWKVMEAHDRIGVEIIAASFHNTELSHIIRNHHAFFAGIARHPDLPKGLDIPLGARILTICDAYDAMTSDRVYRKGRSRQDAFAELRRSAESQFDPDLVEHFIRIIGSRTIKPGTSVPLISQETALQIGIEIEGLAAALDRNDVRGMQVLADRLAATAVKDGIEFLAGSAKKLSTNVDEDAELMEILGSANELLDLCRESQKTYIDRTKTEFEST